MFAAMIASLAPPLSLAFTLYTGVEAATSELAKPAVQVATTQSAQAQDKVAQNAPPAIQLDKFMTPSGLADFCAALTKASGGVSSNAANQLALKACTPGPAKPGDVSIATGANDSTVL